MLACSLFLAATKQVYDSLKDLRENLPPGYSIDIGGSLERSKTSMQFLLQPVPPMFIIILTLDVPTSENVPDVFDSIDCPSWYHWYQYINVISAAAYGIRC